MADRLHGFGGDCVLAVEHAATLPSADAALDMLQQIRRHAEPVLKARGWRVNRLVEMCCCKVAPESGKPPNVAGWCRPKGDKQTSLTIALRLRTTKSKGHNLLPFESLFETMLHEISHIMLSKHTQKFFQLMDTLKGEWEDLLMQGKVLDAKGFPVVGGGQSFGGPQWISPPSSGEARQLAAAAADSRGARAPAAEGPQQGRRLGGAARWNKLSPRERAALAAERRAAEAARGLGDDEEPAEVDGMADEEEPEVLDLGRGRPPPPTGGRKRARGGCACGCAGGSNGGLCSAYSSSYQDSDLAEAIRLSACDPKVQLGGGGDTDLEEVLRRSAAEAQGLLSTDWGGGRAQPNGVDAEGEIEEAIRRSLATSAVGQGSVLRTPQTSQAEQDALQEALRRSVDEGVGRTPSPATANIPLPPTWKVSADATVIELCSDSE